MNVRPPLRTFASATLFAVLCFAQPFALAQDGGDGKGTLTVEGEVTDSTCVVYFKDPTGTQASSSSTLKLTAVKLADLKALKTAGDEYSAKSDKFTIVSLGTSAASSGCLSDGKQFWDFEIISPNTKLIGSKVLLSTVAAEIGSSAIRSNVLVQLKAKVIDLTNPDTTGALDVQPDSLKTLGSQLSNKSGLTATQGFAIGAVYVRPVETPTAGSFSSPITLSVKYP